MTARRHNDESPLFNFSVGHSTRGAKWARRSRTVPGLFIAFGLTWVLLPVLVVLTCTHDMLRDRTFATTRLVCFGAWWLSMEFLGVVLAFVLWVRFAPGHRLTLIASRRAHSRLQRFWARGLATGAKFTIGLRWSITGTDQLRRDGPVIVLARHGSQGDALLTAALLAGDGRRLRFVLKKQLLLDPCLDIVGHRIPNYFVNRDSLDNKSELANISRLSSDLESDEALVIFPEGTRFSLGKLARAVSALTETAPQRVNAAQELCSVLPIRTAGTLAALSTSHADLVFCNHVGVADISSMQQLRNEVPLRNPLTFKIERISRTTVPTLLEEENLIQWLDGQWTKIDRWVTQHQADKSPQSGN